MNWLDYITMTVVVFVAGFIIERYRYNRIRREPYWWKCPDCYFKVGSNQENVINIIRDDHIEKYHPEIPVI